jgi:hypothetical protein
MTEGSELDSLTPADLAMFSKIGVTQDLLAKARVARVTDAEAREVYAVEGDGDYDCLAGLVFPHFDPSNGHRLNYARILLDATQEYIAVTRKGN